MLEGILFGGAVVLVRLLSVGRVFGRRGFLLLAAVIDGPDCIFLIDQRVDV